MFLMLVKKMFSSSKRMLYTMVFFVKKQNVNEFFAIFHKVRLVFCA